MLGLLGPKEFSIMYKRCGSRAFIEIDEREETQQRGVSITIECAECNHRETIYEYEC